MPGNDCFPSVLHRRVISTEFCIINKEDWCCLLLHHTFKRFFCYAYITKVMFCNDMNCKDCNVLFSHEIYLAVILYAHQCCIK